MSRDEYKSILNENLQCPQKQTGRQVSNIHICCFTCIYSQILVRHLVACLACSSLLLLTLGGAATIAATSLNLKEVKLTICPLLLTYNSLTVKTI